MRALITALIILLNFILQTTVLRGAAIAGQIPDTALIIVVSFAFFRGDVEGALVGFFAGLLRDLFFGQFIGMYALMYALTGFLCGKPLRSFYRENWVIPLVMTAISVFSNHFIFYIFNFLLFGQIQAGVYFRSIILPLSLYTIAVSPIINRLLYYVNKRLAKRERKRTSMFARK